VAIPLVIAHRGASAEKPENTLAAFRRALALGADGIELDVHVTRDGVPVVFHDSSLSRLTGARGRIAGWTRRQLKELRVNGTDPIPSLAAVLRLIRGRALVQVELKAGVPVAPVVDAIEAARAAATVILGSFDATLVHEARRLAPALPRMLISEGRAGPATLVRQLAALGASGLSVNHRAIRSAEWLRYFQSRGCTVWCWTVNEEERMRELAGWGVDAILSDDPGLLHRTLSPSLRKKD